MDYAKKTGDFGRQATGTSLAVRQFAAVARGEVGVHRPSNPFAIVRVETRERYCLVCGNVRWHDVVVGWHGGALFDALMYCRTCGGVTE